jgi:O-6-methylguanine DNA methyltransferase
MRSTTLSRTAESNATAVVTLDSPLGWISYTHQDGLLLGLVFGYPTRWAAESALDRAVRANGSSDRAKPTHDDHKALFGGYELADEVLASNELAERLEDYAAGRPVDFSDVAIDVTHLTPFSRRVVKACRQIPWGETRSYAQLASTAGSPGAARAVGQVMARNRFPLVVPCHRVLAAGGRLGGFSAPDGTRMKKRLLALESEARR